MCICDCANDASSYLADLGARIAGSETSLEAGSWQLGALRGSAITAQKSKLGNRIEPHTVLGPQKYVKQWPFGLFSMVLGHCFHTVGVQVDSKQLAYYGLRVIHADFPCCVSYWDQRAVIFRL